MLTVAIVEGVTSVPPVVASIIVVSVSVCITSVIRVVVSSVTKAV